MDFKQIQDLIKLINKSNIGELKIEQGDFKITIKQKEDKYISVASSAAPMQMMPAMPAQHQSVEAPAALTEKSSPSVKEENLVTIKSPMIGTFYRKPSPDKPLFVEVGDDVTVGKVVCIIEAMKLFNEIESEVSGKVVKILVEDSTPVEYDQPLFLVDPS